MRCARCRDAWFVTPAPEEPAALDVEARSARHEADLVAPPPASGRRAARPRSAPGALTRLARRLRPLGAALLVLLGLGSAAGTVRGREAVVRAVPATARLYAVIGLAVNLRGLEFRGVSADLAAGAGQGGQGDQASQGAAPPSLVVEGEIANVAGRPVPVPLVEIAVRERAGAPPLYTWTTPSPRDVLGPGETVRFRARLIEPPAEGREVALRFAPLPAPAVVAAHAP